MIRGLQNMYFVTIAYILHNYGSFLFSENYQVIDT